MVHLYNWYKKLCTCFNTQNSSPLRTEFIRGMRDIRSSTAGILAWSIVTAIAMSQSILTLGQTFGMSWLVYAGSSQIAALPLLGATAPIWTILLTAFCVNLRFVVFSALLQPHFKLLPLWRRILISYLSVDIVFFLFNSRFTNSTTELHSPTAEKEAYFYGLGVINMLAWQAGAVIGVVIGHFIPDSWGLSLAGILVLLALLLPLIATRPGLLAGITAAVVAVITYSLPYKLNLVLAVISAVAVGLWAEEWMEKKQARGIHHEHS